MHTLFKRVHSCSCLLLFFLALTFVACKKNKPGSGGGIPAPKSSEKTMLTFAFKAANNSAAITEDYNGMIDGDTVRVQVNKGVDITALVPSITYTSVSISPDGNVAQNFSNLITYTLTAEDGSTKKYIVKVVLVKANLFTYFGSDDGNIYALNTNTGKLVWKYTTGGPVQSSPALVNNVLYIGSNDKNLYAIDATTGTLKWKYATAAPVYTYSPMISGNTVFISSTLIAGNGKVYAIDINNGLLKWEKNIYTPTSPLVYGGKVFVGNGVTGLVALDEQTGNNVWTAAGGIIKSNVAVNNDKIYAGGEGSLYCFNASTGAVIWSTPSVVGAGAPTIDNQTVYAGSEYYMKAFDLNTGAFKWQYYSLAQGNNNTGHFSNPVVLNNIVYAGNDDGNFYALNANNGTLAWANPQGLRSGIGIACPTACNGIVYAGSHDKNLYAYDASTGAVKWKFTTGGGVYSGPCIIDSDGTVFHSGGSGHKN